MGFLIKYFILLILIIPSFAFGANYYVTPTGAGDADGSDWSNALAWATFTPVRGDGTNVYYIAGGSYTSAKMFNVAADSNKVITIRKATATQCALENAPANCADQAVFTSATATYSTGIIRICTDDWVLDGVTGGGPTSWTSGYGFKFDVSQNKNIPALMVSTSYGTCGSYHDIDNITLSHIEFYGEDVQDNTSVATDRWNQAMYFANIKPAVTYTNSNFTIEYIYQHGINQGNAVNSTIADTWMMQYIFIDGSDVRSPYVMVLSSSPESDWSVGNTITGVSSEATTTVSAKVENNAYSVAYPTGSFTPGETVTNGTYTATLDDILVPHHYAAFRFDYADDITIRYSIFKDMSSTGCLGCYEECNDFKIYGNIFVANPTWPSASSADAIYANTSAESITNYTIYNNSFIHWQDAQVINFTGSETNTNNVAYANIFYDTAGGTPARTGVTSDYNWYYPSFAHGEAHSVVGVGDPFVSWATGDYTLATGIDSGTSFLSPYNMDMSGNIRGSDGVWDMGALEYGGNTYPAHSFSGGATHSVTTGSTITWQ